MSVTAQSLSQKGLRGKDVEAIVREQNQIIDNKLQQAPVKWGRNVVVHELPTNYTLPGLEKADTQRLVYVAILRGLLKRGFEVRLLLENEVSMLYIAWVTDFDADEIEAMNALLRATRITRENVERFVEVGGLPAPRTALAVQHGLAPAPRLHYAPAGEMLPRGGVVVRPRAATGAQGASQPGRPAPPTAAELALLHGQPPASPPAQPPAGQ